MNTEKEDSNVKCYCQVKSKLLIQLKFSCSLVVPYFDRYYETNFQVLQINYEELGFIKIQCLSLSICLIEHIRSNQSFSQLTYNFMQTEILLAQPFQSIPSNVFL
ncbi:hypothetical protein ABPG72_005590 [Tetrahymena utriculariae]